MRETRWTIAEEFCLRREWRNPQHQQQFCVFEVMVSKHAAFFFGGRRESGLQLILSESASQKSPPLVTRGVLFCVGEIVAPLCARDKQIGVSLPCSFEYKESCSLEKQAVRTYTPPEIFASATQKVSALDALTSTGIFKKHLYGIKQNHTIECQWEDSSCYADCGPFQHMLNGWDRDLRGRILDLQPQSLSLCFISTT